MRDPTCVQIAETKIRCVVYQAAIFKSKRGVLHHRDRKVSSSTINEGTYCLPLRAQYTSTIINRVKYQGSALCKNVGAQLESARRG